MLMELRLKLSDDMQLRPLQLVRCVAVWTVSLFKELSKSDWIMSHCLLLAQSLAVSFYALKNVRFKRSLSFDGLFYSKLLETIMSAVKKVLNVGSGGSRHVPDIFATWELDTLDIDADVHPDIVCDARQMHTLNPAVYDAVYSSHCLEHFYKHEVPGVLGGFAHVLKDDGFVHLEVPDMSALFTNIAGHDINDTWYMSAGGPITFHDVIYGWGAQVGKGNLHYCHKTGFTEKSLAKSLKILFPVVMTAADKGNLYAFAFKRRPSRERMRLLEI